MTKNLGKSYSLWSLAGWFKPAPTNLSKQERETVNRMQNGLSSPLQGGMQEYYMGQTSRNSDPQQHFGEMEEMAGHEIVAPVLAIYAEEATQPDSSNGKVIWYECDDSEVEEDLNKMLERVNADDDAYAIHWDLAAFGNSFRRLLRTEANGIEHIVPIPVSHIRRIYDLTTKRLLGFKWAGHEPMPEQAVRLTSGSKSENIFPPWDFLHFRRITSRTTSESEYGTSMVEHLFTLYRRIKLSVDQMVVYRLHAMPSRWICWVDTGTQTAAEQSDTLTIYRNFLRSTMALDENKFESRFNPPAMDSILFFPKPTGDESKIDQMQGTNDVPDVPDIDLLTKMFFGGARVPRSYVGFGEDDGSLANNSLASKDIRFARLIRVLRQPAISGYARLADIQMVLKDKDPSKYKVTVQMSSISAIEDEVKAATILKQAEVANVVSDICQKLTIPNKEIIDLVFREYLHVPRKFADVAKLAAAVQQVVGGPEGAPGGGGGMSGMPMGGGGGIGDDLGLPPEEPEGAPEVEVDGDQPPPIATTGQESVTALQHTMLLELRTAIKGKHKQLIPEMKRLSNTMRSLYRIHATGRVSLVETSRVLRSKDALPTGRRLTEGADASTIYSGTVLTPVGLAEAEGNTTVAESHPAVKAVHGMRKAASGSQPLTEQVKAGKIRVTAQLHE
jgi:hypothetical protein